MPRDTVEEFHLLFAETQKAPSPAASDNVLRALQGARKWLSDDPKRWAKHNGYARCNEPRRCALNTISDIIVGFTPDKFVMSQFLDTADYLDRFTPAPFSGVATFNDHPSTTHADIIALFDRAISSRLAEIEG